MTCSRTLALTVAALAAGCGAGCSGRGPGPELGIMAVHSACHALSPMPMGEAWERAAKELAQATCQHAVACGHVGSQPDALHDSEEACRVAQAERASTVVTEWACATPPESPGLRACLAAVRKEPCSTRIARADQLDACQRATVCGLRCEK